MRLARMNWGRLNWGGMNWGGMTCAGIIIAGLLAIFAATPEAAAEGNLTRRAERRAATPAPATLTPILCSSIRMGSMVIRTTTTISAMVRHASTLLTTPRRVWSASPRISTATPASSMILIRRTPATATHRSWTWARMSSK